MLRLQLFAWGLGFAVLLQGCEKHHKHEPESVRPAHEHPEDEQSHHEHEHSEDEQSHHEQMLPDKVSRDSVVSRLSARGLFCEHSWVATWANGHVSSCSTQCCHHTDPNTGARTPQSYCRVRLSGEDEVLQECTPKMTSPLRSVSGFSEMAAEAGDEGAVILATSIREEVGLLLPFLSFSLGAVTAVIGIQCFNKQSRRAPGGNRSPLLEG